MIAASRTHRLRRIWRHLDRWRQRNDHRVSCSPTCGGGCCAHLAMPVGRVEAQLVAQVLTEAQWARVRAVDPALADDLGIGAGGCPLSTFGRCGAYASRPLVCRAYHVTSDPLDCDPRQGPRPVLIAWPDRSLLDQVRAHMPRRQTRQTWLISRLQALDPGAP